MQSQKDEAIQVPERSNLGLALGGTYGEPSLAGSGELETGSRVSLALTGALEDATAWFVVGLVELNVPFMGGTLVPAFNPPSGLIVVLQTDGEGEIAITDAWPAGVPPGLEIYVQYWIDDPGGSFGFAASNAIQGTTP